MKIKIKCFGQIEDLTGRSELEFDVKGKLSKNELVDLLESKYSSLNKASYQVAVNQTFISEDGLISSKDEVVLLPPFAGG